MDFDLQWLLLGLPVRDRDHVVVGATPEEMRARGFRPVGKDFPVFLHPETHEEYVLARTERKTAPGYTGFVVHAAPEVTLEDDLLRRDVIMALMCQGRLDFAAIERAHGVCVRDAFAAELQALQQQRLEDAHQALQEELQLTRLVRSCFHNTSPSAFLNETR